MNKNIKLIKRGFESVNLKFNKINNKYITYIEDVKSFSNFIFDVKKYGSEESILQGKNIMYQKMIYKYKYKTDVQKSLEKQLKVDGDYKEGELLIEDRYYEKNIYYFYKFISILQSYSDIFHLGYKEMNSSLGFQINLKPFDENTEKLKEKGILFFNINLNVKTQLKVGYLRVSFLGKMEEVFNYLYKNGKTNINLNKEYKKMLKNITNEHLTRVDYYHDFYTEKHMHTIKDYFKIYNYKTTPPVNPAGKIIGEYMHITNSATYYYISNKNNSYYDAKKNKNIISRLYNKFEDNKYKNKSFLYDYNDKKLRRFEIETQTQAHNKFKERQGVNKEINCLDYINLYYLTIMNMKEENNKEDPDFKYKLPFHVKKRENLIWKKRENIKNIESITLKSSKFLKKGIKMLHDDELNIDDLKKLIELAESKKDKNLLKKESKKNNERIKEIKKEDSMHYYMVERYEFNEKVIIYDTKKAIEKLFLKKI